MSVSAPFVRGHVDLVGVTGNADSTRPSARIAGWVLLPKLWQQGSPPWSLVQIPGFWG